MSIEMLALCGAAAGLIAGLAFSSRIGCLVLLAVPIGMIAYIQLWQNAHPENLASTSGLDFLFGPLWPSLGAFAGFAVGKIIRAAVLKRED